MTEVTKKQKADAERSMPMFRMLLTIPSFGPETGKHLLRIRERLLEELPKHKKKLCPEDLVLMITYADALHKVASIAAIHQGVAIKMLQQYVEQGRIESTFDQLEESNDPDED